jgi:hypothetical protein
MMEFLTSLAVGDINLLTGLVWFLIAIAFSMIGGAIGGILLGGKELGYDLSAMLGGLLGPAGVIPMVLLGLVALNIIFSN